MFSRELKKGSTELLVLSLLEARARHGYDLGRLIEERSGGKLKYRIASLYPLLCRLETRGIIVVEQSRVRVRERNVLRYYARTLDHLLASPSRRTH